MDSSPCHSKQAADAEGAGSSTSSPVATPDEANAHRGIHVAPPQHRNNTRKTYLVYLLESIKWKDPRYSHLEAEYRFATYIGYTGTWRLYTRLSEHNQDGRHCYTQTKRPWAVVATVAGWNCRSDAMVFEKQLKRYRGGLSTKTWRGQDRIDRVKAFMRTYATEVCPHHRRATPNRNQPKYTSPMNH